MFKKLKLVQRLGLLASLFAIPVIFVLWSLIAQKHVETDFSSKEVTGTRYLEAVSPILYAFEARQIDSTIDVAGTADALRDAQARLAGNLDTKAAADAAIAAAAALAANPSDRTLIANAQDATMALIARIGDRSNLILDNVLETYYLADIVLNRAPTLLDKLPDVSQKAGLQFAHDEFMQAIGAATSSRGGLDASLDSSIANDTDGSSKRALDGPHQTLKAALDLLLSKYRDGQRVDTLPVLAAVQDFNEKTLAELLRLLKARVHSLVVDEYVSIGVSFLLFAAALALLAFAAIREITSPVARLTATMGAIAGGNLDESVPATERFDEIGDMARATEIFLSNARRNRELEEAQKSEEAFRRRRQEALEALNASFNDAVTGQLHMVGAASTELEATAEGLLTQADATGTRTAQVERAVTVSSESTQAVAAATEQLAASSNEIGQQIERTTLVTREAVTHADRASALVHELSAAVGGVTNVVSFINDIASQTNLLALNATIESARAGDAGKGFAVVASEVKALANQTAQATGVIAEKITAVQNTADDVAGIIRQIAEVVAQIDGNSGAVAAAVTEQASATGEISRSANNAAEANREMAMNMGELRESANFTKNAARQLFDAAADLAKQSETLRGDFESFIASVSRAGDRRMHERFELDRAVTVSGRHGANLPGRTVNISQGGAALRCDGVFGIAEEIQIDGLDQTRISARVIEAKDGYVRVLFRVDQATTARIRTLLERLDGRAAA